MGYLRTSLFMMFFLAVLALQGQSERKNIYDPSLDAREEIGKMLEQARTDGKHVLLQVGGNW